MKETGWKFFAGGALKKLFFFIFILLVVVKARAQCDPLSPPSLFGPSQPSIFCKDGSIPIGVAISDEALVYYFSKSAGGKETSRKGGPLAGSGNTLSVSAVMRSASDAGEYSVYSVNSCNDTSVSSFTVFYGSIDNLSISSWGNNKVTFKWTACGPAPAVTYDYVVSTRSNPDLILADSILTTPATTATVTTGLISGTTYYIHVRLNSVFWDDRNVEAADFNSNCGNTGSYPWQSIRFVSCGGASTMPPSITPANSFGCTGANMVLTAGSGASTYRWYREDNSQISGAMLPTYTATSAGQYKVFITTAGVCQGMVSTATVTQAPIQTCLFSGSNGDFYSGDTVTFYLRNTLISQTYKLLRDGVEVYSTPGIGDANESDGRDSIIYKFVITSAAQAGVYTVRITSPYCSSVDVAGGSTINYISGVTICPNSNTSFTFSSPGNNTNFQWQVALAGSSTFNNISNGGIYSGATTKKLTITNASGTMYGYKYRCVASGGVGVTSSTRTLRFGVTWLGVSATWGSASNWSCNVVPNANLDVIIPAGTPNQPIITTNVTCHSVLTKSGITLSVNAPNGKLNITGQ